MRSTTAHHFTSHPYAEEFIYYSFASQDCPTQIKNNNTLHSSPHSVSRILACDSAVWMPLIWTASSLPNGRKLDVDGSGARRWRWARLTYRKYHVLKNTCTSKTYENFTFNMEKSALGQPSYVFPNKHIAHTRFFVRFAHRDGIWRVVNKFATTL